MRIRIGFISSKKNNSISALSGGAYYMEKALKKHCGEVVFLKPNSTSFLIIGKIINRLSNLFLGRNYASQHSLISAYYFGKTLDGQIRKNNIDIIFATRASTQIAFLKTKIPIIYTSDATFEIMEDYYGYWTNLNKISLIEGNYIEKRAINNSARIFYPSSWPINSAVQNYKADPSKLSIIKSGANFDYNDIPTSNQIFSQKDLSRCRLLFVGVDWIRKGGEIAVETLNHLLSSNIPAELTIVGCEPPKKFLNNKIMVIKRLDKAITEERNRLITLYRQANFFLLPTRADASGLVLSEAAAFGLPVVTTDTGGVASIVRQGINGYTLLLSDGAIAYARLIEQIFRDKSRYENLVRTTRQEYEETLNWDTWGRKVKQLITSIVK